MSGFFRAWRTSPSLISEQQSRSPMSAAKAL
jgi:hypothetical protein